MCFCTFTLSLLLAVLYCPDCACAQSTLECITCAPPTNLLICTLPNLDALCHVVGLHMAMHFDILCKTMRAQRQCEDDFDLVTHAPTMHMNNI